MSRKLVVLVAAALAAVPLRAGVPAPVRAPALLSDTGLFAARGMVSIDPRNLPYAPQYPLWSDGAVKSRWIYLPPGETIDVSDLGAWVFPVGTKLWKEFAFGGRKVETRMIWRASSDA